MKRSSLLALASAGALAAALAGVGLAKTAHAPAAAPAKPQIGTYGLG